jgi:hypothetical protein
MEKLRYIYMSYKESCRTCGTHLRSILICNVCMEMSLGFMLNVEKVEDITLA